MPMFGISLQYRVLFVYNGTVLGYDPLLYLHLKCHSPYSKRGSLLFELS